MSYKPIAKLSVVLREEFDDDAMLYDPGNHVRISAEDSQGV